MQQIYAIKTCNTDLQYRYAIKIGNGYATYMQRHAAGMQQICNIYATYMQRHATDMQHICNRYETDMQ